MLNLSSLFFFILTSILFVLSWNQEEEEAFDDFPFNMSDFVTVDEVGDVADLPSPPPPSVLMETTAGGEDAHTSVQQNILGVHKKNVFSAWLLGYSGHGTD